MSAVVKGDELCTGFQPQTWRKNRCRLCYREKEDHSVSNDSLLTGSIDEKTSSTTNNNSTTADIVAAPPRRVRPTTASLHNDEAPPVGYRTRSRNVTASDQCENSDDSTSKSQDKKPDHAVMKSISGTENISSEKVIMLSKQEDRPMQMVSGTRGNNIENKPTVTIRSRRSRDQTGSQSSEQSSASSTPSPTKSDVEVFISLNRPLKSLKSVESSNLTDTASTLPSCLPSSSNVSTSEVTSSISVPLSPRGSASEVATSVSVPSTSTNVLQEEASPYNYIPDMTTHVPLTARRSVPEIYGSDSLGDLGVSSLLSASYESVATTIGDESMHSALSGSFESLATTTGGTLHSALSGSMESILTTTSIATTENLQETIEDLETMIRALKAQLEATEEKCINMEAEKNRIIISKMESSGPAATVAEVISLRTQLREMEKQCEESRDESTVLKLEVKELREELHSKDSRTAKLKVKDLKQKLQAAESLCEELMDENENAKRTIKEIQEEMEEMQDKYRQEQADEFRDLQGEMEQTSKNCRILQFKLRKAERRNEEIEADKQQYEQKLKELTSVMASSSDTGKVKQLEDELSLARDIAARLKNELDSMETRRAFIEKENESLRQKMNEVEKLRDTKAGEELATLKRSGKIEAISQAKTDHDSVELMKDLYDTIERETDLKEQLKFAEEEAKLMRKKLSDMEQENESLLFQLKKMSSTRGLRGSKRSPSPMKDSTAKDSIKEAEKESSHLENLEPSELILQIELAEQEMKVLRRKLSEFENENENLSSEIKLLQKKIQEHESKVHLVEPPDPSKPNLYYEQKVKLLENEAKELRRKLIDKEREIERLGTEVNLEKRKSKNLFTRSRSLDSDQQLDLKRHLQLVEQEAIILRQKMLKYESENEKLLEENRRLQLRALRRTPSTQSEDVASENADLKEKLYQAQQELEKLKDVLQKEKDKNITLSIEVDEAKQKAEESKDSRTASKTLSEKLHRAEDELKGLHQKLASTENENSVISNQLKRILAKGGGKEMPYFNVESAAPKELRNKVKDLNEEIKHLRLVINTREQMGDQIEEELQENKHLLKQLEEEYKDKEKHLELELAELNRESQVLQHQLELLRQRTKDKQQEQDKAASSPAIRPLRTDTEGSQLKERIEGLEKQLAEEKVRCQIALKKLALLDGHETKVYLDIRLHEKEKSMLKEQLSECQKKLNQADIKLQIVQNQIKDPVLGDFQVRNENQGPDIVPIKKEIPANERPPISWNKERDQLQKEVEEFKKRSEQLQKQLQEKKQKEEVLQQRKTSIPKNEQDIEEVKNRLEAEISSLEEECNKYKFQYEEIQIKLGEMKSGLEEAKQKLKDMETKYLEDKQKLKEEQSELEVKFHTERKTRENEIKQKETRLKQKEDELIALDRRIKNEEGCLKSLEDKLKKQDMEYRDKLKQREEILKLEQSKCKELEIKCAAIQEQLMLEKKRLVKERDQMESNLLSLKREHDGLIVELRNLRETYNTRNDSWIKEKLKLEEQIREMEKRDLPDILTSAEKQKLMGDIKGLENQAEIKNKIWNQEKEELKRTIEEKTKIIETHEGTERRTLEDLEKLKIQLNEIRKKQTEEQRLADLTKESSSKKDRVWSLEKEELMRRLRQADKLQRAELAALQMRYESRIKFLDDEVHSLQIQVRKLKRERDSFREMLDVAERNILDLKNNMASELEKWSKERTQLQKLSEGSGEKNRVQDLKKNIEDLTAKVEQENREKLALRNRSAAERNMLEMKLAEIQTKFNQLEEKSILTSNVRSWSGGKSKMESAWEKERQEQKRLLADSHNFAKDLQEQLRNLEKSYENEKAQMKIQMEQLKHDKDREKLELQRKLKEFEENYSRLHDTHSRLRDLQEKFKREHELLRRERDELVERLTESDKKQAMERAKIDQIIDEIQRIKSMAPLLDASTELREDASAEIERRVSRMLGLPPRARTDEREASRERPTFKRQDSSELLKKAIEKLAQDAEDYTKENRPKRTLSLHKRSLSASNVVDATNMSSTLSKEQSSDKSYTRTSSDGRVTLETTFGLDEKSLPPSIEGLSAIPPPASKWPLPRRITNYPKPPPSLIISPPRRSSSKVCTFRKTQSLDDPSTSSPIDSPPILDEKNITSRMFSTPRFSIHSGSSDNEFPIISAPTSTIPSNGLYHSLPNLKRGKHKQEKSLEEITDLDLSSSFDKSDEEVSQKSDDSQTSSKAKWINWPPRKSGKDKTWKIFQRTKIESTPVGSSVAKIGVQVLPPAVTPPPSSPQKEEKEWKFKLHLPWKKSSLQRAKSMDSPDIAKALPTREMPIPPPISPSKVLTGSESTLTKLNMEDKTIPDRTVLAHPKSIIVRTPSYKWRSRSFDESLSTSSQRSFTETPV